MGVQITNGRLIVSAGYGLTQNLGDYSSQKASAGLTIEADAEGDPAVVLAEGQKLYDQLIMATKLGVMANLGIEGEVDADGVLQPNIKPAVAAAPAPAPQAPPVPYGGGGGGGGGNFKPAADTSNLPQFVADLDGRGPATWIDLRPLKADGTFKPTAADFRDAADKKHQCWLKDKGGNVKASVAQALQAAGVAV